MKTPLLLNDNRVIHEAGDIEIFKTASALEAFLEPWYVNEPHFIFDSEGTQLEISSNGARISLRPIEPKIYRPEIARIYFVAFLKSIIDAKGWEHVGVTEDFLHRSDLSELASASARFATS